MLLATVTTVGMAFGLISLVVGVNIEHIPIMFAVGFVSFAVVIVVSRSMDTSAKVSDLVGWGYLLSLSLASAVFGSLRLLGAGGQMTAWYQICYAVIFGTIAVWQLYKTFKTQRIGMSY